MDHLRRRRTSRAASSADHPPGSSSRQGKDWLGVRQRRTAYLDEIEQLQFILAELIESPESHRAARPG